MHGQHDVVTPAYFITDQTLVGSCCKLVAVSTAAAVTGSDMLLRDRGPAGWLTDSHSGSCLKINTFLKKGKKKKAPSPPASVLSFHLSHFCLFSYFHMVLTYAPSSSSAVSHIFPQSTHFVSLQDRKGQEKHSEHCTPGAWTGCWGDILTVRRGTMGTNLV